MKKRKDGLYYQQVTINGKRKVFSSKDKKKLMLKVAMYRQENSGLPFFRDVAEAWKEEHWDEIQFGTFRCYNAPFTRLLEQFGDSRLDEITPQMLRAYFQQQGKKYAYKTVANTKTVLNQIFNYAIVEKGVDLINPVASVTIPKNLARNSRNVLTPEQCAEILKTGKDEFQLAYLIYFTGLRCAEAIGLTMKSVDLKNNVINVTQSIHHHGNRPEIGTLKSQSAYRQIPLPEELKARIKALHRAPDEFIVSGAEPLTKSALTKRWLHWCKDHGLVEDGKPTIDRHQIRHTYTTMLYNAGVDVKSMQEILGHSDISMTLRTYTHLTQEQFNKASAQINGIFERNA